ncbi:hypothetical protein BC827DRAFT_1272841 [Russula dissimulans]|nr:hypothetical protein BC827DRAFT_1272841 [Russula dissimulans]
MAHADLSSTSGQVAAPLSSSSPATAVPLGPPTDPTQIAVQTTGGTPATIIPQIAASQATPSDVTMLKPGPVVATLTPGDAAQNVEPGALTSNTVRHNLQELWQKRYHRKERMTPGYRCTARNFYAEDWCKLHPEGTIGEFNREFDFLDPKVLEPYKQREKVECAEKTSSPS